MDFPVALIRVGAIIRHWAVIQSFAVSGRSWMSIDAPFYWFVILHHPTINRSQITAGVALNILLTCLCAVQPIV